MSEEQRIKDRRPYKSIYYGLAYQLDILCGSVHRWSIEHFTPISNRHLYRAQLDVFVKEIQRDTITGWVWEVYYRPLRGTSITLTKGEEPQISLGKGEAPPSPINDVPLGTITVYRTGSKTCVLKIEGLAPQELQKRLESQTHRLSHSGRQSSILFVLNIDLLKWIDEDLVKESLPLEIPPIPNWKREGSLACIRWFLEYGKHNNMTEKQAAEQMDISLRQFSRVLSEHRNR